MCAVVLQRIILIVTNRKSICLFQLKCEGWGERSHVLHGQSGFIVFSRGEIQLGKSYGEND